jgi:hypothetical protein
MFKKVNAILLSVSKSEKQKNAESRSEHNKSGGSPLSFIKCGGSL